MKGIAYYPEQWPIEMLKSDMKRIAAMGANTIRIGEFAWHRFEPQENHYDFRYFDAVIAEAKRHDLKIIFGTPTATAPRWLSMKYDVHAVDVYGRPHSFGGRRLYCYSNPIYRQLSINIVTALMEHYQHETAIIAWQVDNELGHEGSDICYCDHCLRSFQDFLAKKYDTIDQLNDHYGTEFWSQRYDNFKQVVIPKPTITIHNPALVLDWYRFRSDTMQSFLESQVKIIAAYRQPGQQITHNFFGGYFDVASDQATLAQSLDIASYDNYPVWGGMYSPLSGAQIARSLDYIRGLKQGEFWIAEQLIGAQGHAHIGYRPTVKQAVLWAKQAVLRGASGLCFFRYRTNPKGQEQLCQGIYDVDNSNNEKVTAVAEFFDWQNNWQRSVERVTPARVAIVYDYDNRWSWHHQPHSEAFDYEAEIDRYYRACHNMAIPVDVLASSANWQSYDCVIMPVMQMVDAAIVQGITRVLAGGGCVLLGYRSAVKDRFNNLVFAEKPPCGLNDLFGVTVQHFEALGNDQVCSLYGAGQRIGNGSIWRDELKTTTATALMSYDASGQRAACTVHNDNAGRAYYIGTALDDAVVKQLLVDVFSHIQVTVVDKPVTLELIPCSHGYYALNHSANSVTWHELTFTAYEVCLLDQHMKRIVEFSA